MTIKSLRKLIDKFASSAVYQVFFNHFKGKKVAVDTSFLGHKFWSTCWYTIVKNSDVVTEFGIFNIRPSEEQKLQMKQLLTKRVTNYLVDWLRAGIQPIFVLDGKADVAKDTHAREKRNKARKRIRNKIFDTYDEFLVAGVEYYKKQDLKLTAQLKMIDCCLVKKFEVKGIVTLLNKVFHKKEIKVEDLELNKIDKSEQQKWNRGEQLYKQIKEIKRARKRLENIIKAIKEENRLLLIKYRLLPEEVESVSLDDSVTESTEGSIKTEESKESIPLLGKELFAIYNKIDEYNYFPRLCLKSHLIEKKRKYLKQKVPYVGTANDLIVEIARDFGIPVITPKGEAERFCAALNREGLCDAVYSTDYDTLTHGGKILIYDDEIGYDKKTGKRERFFKVINLEEVLSCLEYTHEKFVELCIMAGCDYNNNVRGYGIMKAKRLLDETDDGKIESVKLKGKECLNVETCRRLFKLLKCDEMKTEELKLDLDIKVVEDARFKYEDYERIEEACHFCIKCQLEVTKDVEEEIRDAMMDELTVYKDDIEDDQIKMNSGLLTLIGDCSLLDG